MTMEEILNCRILQVIDFTQAQGGGIKNYSTADHLFLIRGIMTYSIYMHANWTLTFYDIQKAYDKAEREDMIHMLWKKGLRGKVWRLTNLMNKDLTSKIRTPYGLTRLVKREVGGKQAGKIMTTTFAKMTDLLSEEMQKKEEIGIKIGDAKIPCLLFVDDVATTS